MEKFSHFVPVSYRLEVVFCVYWSILYPLHSLPHTPTPNKIVDLVDTVVWSDLKRKVPRLHKTVRQALRSTRSRLQTDSTSDRRKTDCRSSKGRTCRYQTKKEKGEAPCIIEPLPFKRPTYFITLQKILMLVSKNSFQEGIDTLLDATIHFFTNGIFRFFRGSITDSFRALAQTTLLFLFCRWR